MTPSKANNMSNWMKKNNCPQTISQTSYSDVTKKDNQLAPKNSDQEVENSYNSHANRSKMHKAKKHSLSDHYTDIDSDSDWENTLKQKASKKNHKFGIY